MKTATIKASLMTKKARLIDFKFEVTENDFVKGIDFIYEKSAVIIRDRLNIIIDEDNLKEVFE